MLQIQRLSLLDGAKRARGLTVVIDVFRAFSTAAYAFHRGAREVVLVAGVDEALALRERWPDALVMGEVHGRRVPGFDFGNSTTAIATADLAGRRLIQRTSAGTQGVVAAAAGADTLLLGSLVCAGAIVRYVEREGPSLVSLVAMGVRAERPAAEDEACAELLAARLEHRSLDERALLDGVVHGGAGVRFEEDSEDFPRSDLDYCLALDAFGFVMRVATREGLLVATRLDD
jgi:2-phosphosulfolactate phosphatase